MWALTEHRKGVVKAVERDVGEDVVVVIICQLVVIHVCQVISACLGLRPDVLLHIPPNVWGISIETGRVRAKPLYPALLCFIYRTLIL